MTHSSYPIIEMVLFVTNRCNLNCRYCYISGGSEGVLSKTVGEQAIRWFMRQGVSTPRPQMIAFYGGEPLLEYPLIQYLVQFAKEEAGKVNNPIRFGITTNGTLLSESNLYFFQEENIHLIVSIDGKSKTHDSMRKFVSGKGSFAAVEKALPWLLQYRPASFIRMTVNPGTVKDLYENLEFLIDKGLKNFAIAPNIETQWDQEHWEIFESQCRKIANLYLELEASQHHVRINFIDDTIKYLLRGKRPVAPCGAGKTLVGVDIKGEIYPCHRFVSSFNYQGSHKFGDVWKGIDPMARLPFSRYTSEHFLGCYSPCEKCPARMICGGGCLSKGHEYNRNFLLPLKAEQYVYSIWAEIAADVLRYVEAHNVSLYNNFLNNINKKNPNQPGNTLC